MASCRHDVLFLQPSAFAAEAGYERLPLAKRIAATTPTGRVRKSGAKSEQDEGELESSFPAPLVLPEDDIAYEPDYPAQSLLSWSRGKHRNEVIYNRRTLYVAGPPGTDVPGMEAWSQPVTKAQSDGAESNGDEIPHPAQNDVIDYLSAFYHGMDVKPLPSPFHFGPWDTSTKPAKSTKSGPPHFIALNRNNGGTRIRTRPCPDGYFARQLNLNDILDALTDNLPNDAYSLMLLVDQDMYEDDDDDFCCGRAYGGSRIAIVSMARYNPLLDGAQNVERDHAWPASHCAEYVESCCSAGCSKGKKSKAKSKSTTSEQREVFPIREAIIAHSALPSVQQSPTTQSLAGFWLGCVCRTASHELGHCLGIDHCMYYACVMQSTASCAEDARQPPYLCPVDLAKVLKATGADEMERYRALLEFCGKRKGTQLFAAFGGWLKARLRLLGRGDDVAMSG